ncbi:interleukin-8-like [Hypanus sabinus]|uniref:interleukin-8-like n=1 Tax=Hypanus sabinus TaxID=79690 RepID=UPI0028C4279B|nr:interleukin-8-like [Hypanus sabinus]
MNSRVLLTAVALFVLYMASTQAASLGNSKVGLRCQCINTNSKFIHPKQMENIEIIPSGPHCAKTEIIVILKNGSSVCLNPEAHWVKKIIQMVTKSSK